MAPVINCCFIIIIIMTNLSNPSSYRHLEVVVFCTHHLSSFSTMHYFCLLQAYVVVVNDVTRCIYSSVTVCCGVFYIQDKQFYVHDEQPLKSLSGLFGQLVFLDCLYFKLFNYLCVDLALYIIYICKFLLFQWMSLLITHKNGEHLSVY